MGGMTQHNTQESPTDWDSLPEPVTTYLTAQSAGDNDRVLSTFTADAVVTDEGHDYRGRGEIMSWLTGAASEYTFIAQFVGATTKDAAAVDVVQHLEGNFPGGTADLNYRFSLDGALIRRLIIEP